MFNSTDQPVQFPVIGFIKNRPRSSYLRGCNDTAAMKNLLSQGESEAGLLFMSHIRQVCVKYILRLVMLTRQVQRDNRDEHFGICETCHRTVGSTRELLWQVEPPVTTQDRHPAKAGIRRITHTGNLVQPGTFLMLQHYELIEVRDQNCETDISVRVA